MENWTPDENSLGECVKLIQALRDPTRSDHREALEVLPSYAANSTFVMHILYVFCHGGSLQISSDIRQLGGIIVKNYVFPLLSKLDPLAQHYTKTEIICALKDSNNDIRHTASILIGRLSEAYPFDAWRDIFEQLMSFLQANDPILLDGALSAIQLICEDSCEKLSMETKNRPLDRLIPLLIHLFSAPSVSLRVKAISSVNSFIFLTPNETESDWSQQGSAPCAMIQHMPQFLSALSHLATDSDGSVRRTVCQSLVLLASFQMAILQPVFDSVCNFMATASGDSEDSVVIEAFEFWLVLLSDPDANEYLQNQHGSRASGSPSLLDQVVGNSVSKLVLTVDQIEYGRAEIEAENSGEKEVSFKPMHYRYRKTDGDDDVESFMWTTRKQAALVIDTMADRLPPRLLLDLILPKIELCLNSGSVWTIEAGMLALGAISNGCFEEMRSHISSLLPLLTGSLSEASQSYPPELIAISCWVLKRYATFWFCSKDDMEEYNISMDMIANEQYLILTSLLKAMLNRNVQVQCAVCATLGTIFENIEITESHNHTDIIHANLEQILSYIHQGFQIYGVRGTIALSDTLSTLCEALGPLSLESVNSFARAMNPSLVANNPNVPSSFFLPKVIDLFFSTPDNNFLLFPLMECLASISVAVGADIFPYAYNIVARCLHFIADVMQAHSIVENIALQQLDSSYLNNVSDPPSKDFAVCSLDVIGCVAVAIRELFRSNILGFSENDQNNPQNNQYHQIRSEFLQILFQCMMDKDTDVKQSAFSLVGDIVSQGQCVMLFLTVPPPAFAALLPSTHPENINLTSDTSIGNNSLTSMLQFCLLNIGALSCTSTPKIASNAMWAIGETCMAAGSEITQRFVGGILLHVAHVLMQLSSSSTQTLTESMLGQDDDAYRGVDVTLILKENTVITLGRLCMLCPLECINVQNGMILSSEFLRFWFRNIKNVPQGVERDNAFSGMIAALNRFPQALFQDKIVIEQFIFACASWEQPPGDVFVTQGLQSMLIAIQTQQGNIWNKVIRRLDPEALSSMTAIFTLPS